MWMTPKQINLLLYSDVIICDTTFGANKYDMSLMLGFGWSEKATIILLLLLYFQILVCNA